jgi:hypothetical protein
MFEILVGGAFLSLVKEKVKGGCCGHNRLYRQSILEEDKVNK